MFIFLSIAFHAFLLVALASSIKLGEGEMSVSKSDQVMAVNTVNLPPEAPPPSEAPPAFEPPPVSAPDPGDAIAVPQPTAMNTAIPTPTPTAVPAFIPTPLPSTTPTPFPTPAASGAPELPEATPTPMSTPSVGPTPRLKIEATPVPESADRVAEKELAPELQKLKKEERFAAQYVVKDLLKKGALADAKDLTELPFGYDSWEQYAASIGPAYEAEAKRLGMLPNNTGLAPEPGTVPEPGTTPESGDPSSTNGEGSSTGTGNGTGGGWFSGFSGLDNKSIKTDQDLDPIAKPDFKNPFADPKALDKQDAFSSLNKKPNLSGSIGSLSLPTPKPIVLPKYKTSDLGALAFIGFDYDGHEFRLDWSPQAKPGAKKVTVKYFPKGNSSQQQSFEMPWRTEWDAENKDALVQDALQGYERRKKTAYLLFSPLADRLLAFGSAGLFIA